MHMYTYASHIHWDKSSTYKYTTLASINEAAHIFLYNGISPMLLVLIKPPKPFPVYSPVLEQYETGCALGPEKVQCVHWGEVYVYAQHPVTHA